MADTDRIERLPLRALRFSKPCGEPTPAASVLTQAIPVMNPAIACGTRGSWIITPRVASSNLGGGGAVSITTPLPVPAGFKPVTGAVPHPPPIWRNRGCTIPTPCGANRFPNGAGRLTGSMFQTGARGGTRTHHPEGLVPKTSVATNYTTRANCFWCGRWESNPRSIGI